MNMKNESLLIMRSEREWYWYNCLENVTQFMSLMWFTVGHSSFFQWVLLFIANKPLTRTSRTIRVVILKEGAACKLEIGGNHGWHVW